VATFLKQCTRGGLVHRGDPHTLRQFLIHLRTHGSDLSDALTQYLAMRRTLGRVDRLVF
jgi:hypothetical protein